jgi:hypothetical protein
MGEKGRKIPREYSSQEYPRLISFYSTSTYFIRHGHDSKATRDIRTDFYYYFTLIFLSSPSQSGNGFLIVKEKFWYPEGKKN